MGWLRVIVLYLLLRDRIAHLSQIVIDPELVGHETTIKEHVLNLFRQKGLKVDPQMMYVWRVGKKSPAHSLAWRVFNGLLEPNRKITTKEILAEFGA